MGNILTNQLRLMQKTYVTGLKYVFDRSLKATTDCSQVIFRGDYCRGLVDFQTPPERRVKVRIGDVIIHVYFAPCMYTLTGTVATKDKYKRVYDIPLELKVSDPRRAAKEYFQEKDPAKQAIDQIKIVFEKEASKHDHDRIPNLELPFGSWNTIYLSQIGIQIVQYGKTMFREDLQRTELFAIQNELKNRREKIDKEAEFHGRQVQIERDRESTKKEYERQELAKQNRFDRLESTKQQMYEICYNLRKVAAEEITQVLKERIHEGFERGRTSSEISGEYFALMAIFDNKMHSHIEDSIIAGMSVDGSIEYGDEVDTDKIDNCDNGSS